MKLTNKALNEMIMQEISQGTMDAIHQQKKRQDPEAAERIEKFQQTKSQLGDPKSAVCQFVWSSAKEPYRSDQDGSSVAQLMRDVMARQLGADYEDPEKKSPPEPWGERSDSAVIEGGKGKSWKIYGSPMHRGKLTAEVAKILRKNGIEAYSAADAELFATCNKGKKIPGNVVDKGKGLKVMWTVFDENDEPLTKKEGWYFAYKPSKTAKSGYATKFEGNLITAINGSYDESVAGSINDDEQTKEIAVNIINSINWAGEPNKAQRGSGKSYTLSDMYEKHKVKSREPKTDIFIWVDNDQKNVSVKSASGAQYASAQGPEAIAIFEAAFKNQEDDKHRDYYKQVEKIMTAFGSRATGEGMATFEAMKKAFSDNETALQGVVSRVNLGDCTDEKSCAADIKQLEKLAKDPAARKKAIDHYVAVQKEKMGKMDEAAKEKAQKEITKVLDAADIKISATTSKWVSNNKHLILREAVTGENKFVKGSDAIADSILKWDDEDPANSVFEELDPEWFTKHVDQTKFDFRNRGGSGIANRGIAMRLDDMGPPKKKLKESAILITEEVQRNARLIEISMLLSEDLGSWVKSTWDKTTQQLQSYVGSAQQILSKMGQRGKALWNTIKSMAKEAWNKLKGWADQLYEGAVNALTNGISDVQTEVMETVATNPGETYPDLIPDVTLVEGSGEEGAPDTTIMGGVQKEHLTPTTLSYNMLSEMIENLMSEE